MTCWKCSSLQLFSVQSMQMLIWSCGIALFCILFNMFSLSISVCICLCQHLCITVIYFSISLEVTGCVFLYVLFAFNFSFDSSFLLKPLNFPYLFPIFGLFFQLSLLIQLVERYTVLYLISSVTIANSETSCISNFSLVKENESPFYLLSWGSLRRNEWDGNSNANGCHCWDFLFIRYLISITSHIPKIFYLEGLYCYIPPFCRRGDWDTTWSYGLPKMAEKNLYSNLCLCHGIWIKLW